MVMSLAENTRELDRLFAPVRVLPVLSIRREVDILPLADALLAGGITTLEITLRTAHGLAAIATNFVWAPERCWMDVSFNRLWMPGRSLSSPRVVRMSC